jgi:hypothetical protein
MKRLVVTCRRRRLAPLLLLMLMIWPAGARAQDPVPAISGTSDAFVEAEVTVTEPWLGQQVDYIFRYYEAVDGAQLPAWIRPPDYEAPEFSGFWVEGQPATEAWTEERNGRFYNVAELRTVLFPTGTGEVTIPPARLILYDLFADGERALETLPVTLNVRTLPDGAPPGFEGAVGNLQITAQTDRTTTPVGEPILLRLTLTGQGNLRLAPAPALRELPGWRLLDRGSDVLTEVVEGVAGGTRTFDYMLIPSQGGSATVPPIELVYYDPGTGVYQIAQTPPIVLTAEGALPTPAPASVLTTSVAAEPDADVAQASLSAEAAGADATSPAAKLASGAAALTLMESSGPTRRATPPLTQNPLYWSLWLLPAVALVLGASVRRQARGGVNARRAAHQEARARARAGSETLRALAPPAAYEGPHEASLAAHRALNDYLVRKLGAATAGLGRSGLTPHLIAHGAPPHLAERVVALLKQGDQARYAPLAIDWPTAQQIHANVTVAIRELDQVLR